MTNAHSYRQLATGNPVKMKILALSDQVVPFIYSSAVRRRFSGVDLIIGCGDLPYAYLEYVLTMLDVPLYFVRGNHDVMLEHLTETESRTHPHGGVDLHRQALKVNNVLIAGIEGSLRYRPGNYQYSQEEMWGHVLRLVPRLLVNRALYGRYLDIFVTHAPPAGAHERTDLPHRGIYAFRWLTQVFQPALYLHGHVHLYRPDEPFESQVGRTRLINAFGFREIEFNWQKEQQTDRR